VETVYVVYKEFYVDAACTIKANTITTDENGDALIFGLEAGTYYLVETKAPAGYNLLSYPVQVTLDQTSHHTGDIEATQEIEEIDRTVYVANSNTFRLPETGGIGTAVFTLVGSLMMGGAGVMLVNKKRDEE
ncbi:MAG: LPXTG cell wall anchor domain-containing protein, partial [Lachnospiraceae bacterium]|nr:LPXTG cell wall anchor domain-containing protein [Lachnospiraceae bacterium]